MCPHKKKNRYSPEATEKVRLSRHKRWLEKSIKRHGDRFVYPNTLNEFDTLKRGMVTITCNRHNHIFEILPQDHTRFIDGGCHKCFLERRRERSITKGELKLIKYFNENFIDKYEISSEFIGLRKPIDILCKKHKSIKTITKAQRILVSKHLCDDCLHEESGIQSRKKLSQVESDLDGKLPENITLVDIVFDEKDNQSKVIFKCEFHGERPPVSLGYIGRTAHFCTKCGNSATGYSGHRFKYLLDNNLRGQPYVIALIEVEVFGIRGMKVGITSQRRGLEERYSYFMKKIFFSVVLDEIDILALENRVKVEFEEFRDKSIMGKGTNEGSRWSGDTEIFFFHQKENIINFIKDYIEGMNNSDVDYKEILDTWYIPESFPVNVSREKSLKNIPVPVIGVDMHTNRVIGEFESITSTEKAGYKNVSMILSGERIHSKGVRFFRKDSFDPEDIPPIRRRKNSKRVRCIETGEIFNSLTDAELVMRERGSLVSIAKISTAISKGKKSGGFSWEFADD